MKPVSRKKTRKSSSSSVNPIAQKKETPFFQPKEGGEYTFFQPQANTLPGNVQAKMENSMGEDFSGVSIHKDSAEATGMNALAFTQGDSVHFAPGQYNPDTRPGQELIGHEFAHVKQQRQGRVQASVQMKGRNFNSESSLEAEADSMGRRAAGASVESGSAALGLRRSMSPGKAAGGVVQMKPDTKYGEFKTTKYDKVGDYGVDIELEFHPNAKVDAKKVGLTQTVRTQSNGANFSISPTRANRETANGTRIDQLDEYRNPLYATGAVGAKQTLASTPTHASWGQHAKKDKTGKWTPAILKDTPTLPGRGKNSFQRFETAAVALSGIQKDMYYGSVKWGWKTDAKGVFKQLPVTLASFGDMPTAGFRGAAKKWNDATALGTIRTTGDPTVVYTDAYVKDFELKKDTRVKVTGPAIHNDISYSTITAGAKAGRVKTSDLVDMGNGAATLDLPIPWRGTISAAAANLRKGKSASGSPLAELPKGTKLTVINDKSTWLKVHLDPTQAGVIVKDNTAIDAANLLRGYISKELVKK